MVIPEIPVANALAVITTDNFIHWHDTVYGIFNFFNIDTLNDKQILHHQAVVGANPSVPVVVLTRESGSMVPVYRMQATSLTLTAEEETVAPGGTVALHAVLNGAVTENPDGVEVAPDACTYAVTTEGAALNSRTYVDKFGVLHVQRTIADGTELTVTATSTYVDPSGGAQAITATETVTVDASIDQGDYTITYEWVKDGTYGVPGDVLLPGAVGATSGATVTLAPDPVTGETDAKGTAGTWTFAGWSTSNTGTPVVTSHTVTADVTIYGKWTFTVRA